MNQAFNVLRWFTTRHPVLLWCSFIGVVVAQLLYWACCYAGVEFLAPALAVLHLSFFIPVVTALIAFAHGSELDLTSGKSAMPRWLHTLPIASYWLAIVPMTGMVLWLALAWLPYSVAIQHYTMVTTEGYRTIASEPEITAGQLYYATFLPWVFLCAVGLVLQATSWLPYRSALVRVLTLAGFIALVMYAVVTTVDDMWPNRREYKSLLDALIAKGQGRLLMIAIGATLFGGLFAMVSVAVARQSASVADSDWRGRIWYGLVFLLGYVLPNDRLDGRPVNNHESGSAANDVPVDSRQSALQWRDWKQLGQYPCWVLLGLCVLAFFYRQPGVVLMLPAAIFLCLVSGPTMGKNRFGRGVRPFSPFLASLPISNDEFVYSRLMMVLRTSIVCWGIAACLVLVLVLSVDGRMGLQGLGLGLSVLLVGEFEMESYVLNLIAAAGVFSFVLAVVAPVPGFAVGLFGRRTLHSAAYIGAIGSGFGFLIVFLYGSRHIIAQVETMKDQATQQRYFEQLYDLFFIFLCVVLVIKAILSAATIWLQMKRGIFRLRPILKYGGLILLFYIVASLAIGGLLFAHEIKFHWVAMVLAILVPSTSLLLAPVSIDMNRHR